MGRRLMGKVLTKEELAAKYGTAFQDIRDLSFGVEFPDKQKSVLRPLTPGQYKRFVRTLEGAMAQMIEMGLPTFQLLDTEGKPEGEPFKGKDVTPDPKPVWERDEEGGVKKDEAGLKMPQLDDEGAPILREFPKIRVEVGPEDIREFARNRVKKISATEKEMIAAFESIVWDNAQAILKLLFPEDKSRFTPEYIDRHLNVPFLKTLLSLTADMNGLGFLLPFLKDIFPVLGLMFGQDETKSGKKQTSTTG